VIRFFEHFVIEILASMSFLIGRGRINIYFETSKTVFLSGILYCKYVFVTFIQIVVFYNCFNCLVTKENLKICTSPH